MIVSAHQSLFLPWAGLFNKVAACDIFVVMDNVQVSKGDFINRNRILGPNGLFWLTVPINALSGDKNHINDVLISELPWKNKMSKSIKMTYGNSKFWRDVEPLIEILESNTEKNLVTLNLKLQNEILKILNISTKVVLASEIGVTGYKSEYLLNLCVKTNAKDLLLGSHGVDYADQEAFTKASVKLKFQNFVRTPNDWYLFNGIPISIVHGLAKLGANELSERIQETSGDFQSSLD